MRILTQNPRKKKPEQETWKPALNPDLLQPTSRFQFGTDFASLFPSPTLSHLLPPPPLSLHVQRIREREVGEAMQERRRRQKKELQKKKHREAQEKKKVGVPLSRTRNPESPKT